MDFFFFLNCYCSVHESVSFSMKKKIIRIIIALVKRFIFFDCMFGRPIYCSTFINVLSQIDKVKSAAGNNALHIHANCTNNKKKVAQVIIIGSTLYWSPHPDMDKSLFLLSTPKSLSKY